MTLSEALAADIPSFTAWVRLLGEPRARALLFELQAGLSALRARMEAGVSDGGEWELLDEQISDRGRKVMLTERRLGALKQKRKHEPARAARQLLRDQRSERFEHQFFHACHRALKRLPGGRELFKAICEEAAGSTRGPAAAPDKPEVEL